MAQNELGLLPAEADAELARFKPLFTILDDTPAILPQWEQLVMQYQVQRKNARDVCLVAAMMVHGLSRVLTFNASDFQRYQTITVLGPQQVLGASP